MTSISCQLIDEDIDLMPEHLVIVGELAHHSPSRNRRFPISPVTAFPALPVP
jgi:hypothetical protein